MKTIRWKPSKRQRIAFNYLEDHETTELFYGGGAGGGKSYLGCAWLVYRCIRYPETRYLMGRAVLKSLKDSTLLTFFAVCREWGLKKDKDFKYNSMSGVITWNNGSEIYLKDLYAYPSDPEFDSLGSTEYTGAFLDEVSQITEKAKNIVMSRLRYNLDKYDLLPKLLMASNPAKNFAYREYWKPWKDGVLPKFRKFVPALVGDNPFISKFYEENLKKLDENSRQRLLYGNWNYDDDPTKLFDYQEIIGIFNNDFETDDRDLPYLTVDIARYGSDRTVIVQWKGFKIVKIKYYDETSTKQVRELIETICYHARIPRNHVIVDEDGVGGGVVDETEGITGFINNSRPIELKQKSFAYNAPPMHNFANLKSQCYFYLSNEVKNGRIGCNEIPIEIKEYLVNDLQQIKVKDIDKEGKLGIIGKEEIKEYLGRSPDFSDALMMRMYFELKDESSPYISK